MIIENDSLDSLGLSQFGLGVVLLLVNASTLVLAGSWCARRHLEERMKQRWRHAISDDEYTLLMRIMQQEESGDSSGDRDDDADEEVGRKERTEEGPGGAADGDDDAQNGPSSSLSNGDLKHHLFPPSDVELTKKIGAGSL